MHIDSLILCIKVGEFSLLVVDFDKVIEHIDRLVAENRECKQLGELVFNALHVDWTSELDLRAANQISRVHFNNQKLCLLLFFVGICCDDGTRTFDVKLREHDNLRLCVILCSLVVRLLFLSVIIFRGAASVGAFATIIFATSTFSFRQAFYEDLEVIGDAHCPSSSLFQNDFEEILVASISALIYIKFKRPVSIVASQEGWEEIHVACKGSHKYLCFGIALRVNRIGQLVDEALSKLELKCRLRTVNEDRLRVAFYFNL